MKVKKTSELREELMSAPDLNEYLEENKEQFLSEDIRELLIQIFSRRKISKATLAKRAGMSEVYLHQLFAGQRKPSRDRLICICFGLQASLEEVQQILQKGGFASLYVRNRRDSIIMYGLSHSFDLNMINDRLFQEGEETLT
ncbi:MAG: helix-turn-helix domain-containing protein [Lachnospiraceae bacterium]|nr:helix-turn-helix domain-containing protein [Lachnospiraceae bacterium]